MTYVIVMQSGKYVRKGDGCNDFVENPRDATRFGTPEEARCNRPGHDRDMGGSGFKGTVRAYETEKRAYDALRARYPRPFR